MSRFEYKVVPAPAKGLKAKGVKGAEARFSHALQELMNGLAAYGWEYQRAETLPSVERSGLTSTTTEWRNVLVFRRIRENDADMFAPELLPPPEEKIKGEAQPIETEVEKDKVQAAEKTDEPAWDNGVEDTSDIVGVSASLIDLAAKRNDAKSDG